MHWRSEAAGRAIVAGPAGGSCGEMAGGYGYPTSFFIDAGPGPDGVRLLEENDRFGWRFFPRELARGPLPRLLRAAILGWLSRSVRLGAVHALLIEPPRDSRRLRGLSHAAIA